jgi:hypothetical protein
MTALSYDQVKNQLFQRIPENVVSDIKKFVLKNPPSLWGEQQPRHFLRHMVTLSLYKDAYKVGYQRLVKSVNLNFKITHKSLQKNIERIRRVMKLWAKSQLVLGTSRDWNNAVRNCGLKGVVKDVNLWMDSTDFPLEGVKSVSRKGSKWSYKLNRPGRRYMVLRNGKGKILKLWGGYSPKVYDGTWLEIMKQELDQTLAGGVVIADSHFAKGKTLFENVTFLTNIPKQKQSRKKKSDDSTEGKDLEILTKEQEEFNEAHRRARARVESSFGFIKTKIDALAKPWSESEEQLDCLVWTAAGIHNNCV